ncbi:MAG: hypothetical protein AB2693_19555, partial [Candidatus Thiodiazotropha sp.]
IDKRTLKDSGKSVKIQYSIKSGPTVIFVNKMKVDVHKLSHIYWQKAQITSFRKMTNCSEK